MHLVEASDERTQTTSNYLSSHGIILAGTYYRLYSSSSRLPLSVMKRILVLFVAVASAAFAVGSARAITVATDPVGFANISLPANSETYITVPFTRPADFVGAIQSVSTNTMTITGSPNL